MCIYLIQTERGGTTTAMQLHHLLKPSYAKKREKRGRDRERERNTKVGGDM